MASVASSVYNWRSPKFIKNAKKMVGLEEFLEPEACGQTELPDRSILIGQIGRKSQICKIQLRYLGLG